MKAFEILGGKAYVVELPEGAKHKRIEVRHLGCFLVTTSTRGELMAKLPSGNWRIIGMLSEVTEEQAALVVPIHRQSIIGDVYKNFKTGKWDAFDALESLESAILAEGYYLNEDELEAPNRLDFGYYEDFDAEGHLNGAGWGTDDGEQKYHEAIDKFIADQSRVLDRSRCLLLGREGL